MSLRASVLALLSLISISSTRAETPATVWPDEVTIPNTRIIRFTSTINGEPYAIAVGTPLGPPPDGGYSVIYVLDGEAYFFTGQLFSVAMLDKAPVVVGIGHGALNDKTVIARYAGRTPRGHISYWPPRRE